jgi:hypothetical protein
MIWGCMGWDRVGYTTQIDERVDGDLYVVILEDGPQQTLDYYNKLTNDIICQQNNNLKHTNKIWFQNHGFTVLK